MRNVYGAALGEVFWAASDIGWVVGHSYIVYGPLVSGCATVLYEGKPVGTPDAGAFWRIVEAHRVSTLFTAPTAVRAMRRADPEGEHIKAYDRSSLRHLFLAGERADAPTLNWIGEQLGIPVIDHWWQTELGWPALATCIGLGDHAVKVGSAGKPVPGYSFKLVDANGNPVNVAPTADLDIYTDANKNNFLIGISGRRLFTIDLNQIATNLQVGQTQNITVRGINMTETGGGFIDIAASPFGPAAK